MAAEIGVLAYDDRIKAGNWQRKAATHCLHNALLQLLVCDSFADRPDEPWIDRIVIHLKELWLRNTKFLLVDWESS